MTIVITSPTRRYEVTVNASLGGAEERPLPWGSNGTYRPDQIEVLYRWTSADNDQIADVTLHGHVTRKDGSAGRPKSERLWTREEWPDWVKDFVTRNRPAGGPQSSGVPS